MNTYIETAAHKRLIESIEEQAIENLIKNIKDNTTLKKQQKHYNPYILIMSFNSKGVKALLTVSSLP